LIAQREDTVRTWCEDLSGDAVRNHLHEKWTSTGIRMLPFSTTNKWKRQQPHRIEWMFSNKGRNDCQALQLTSKESNRM
jgi:hypothetical protein